MRISYFILSTPLGSTIAQRKAIEYPPVPQICISTNDNKALYKVIEENLAPVISPPPPPMDPPQFRKITGSPILAIRTSTKLMTITH
jgi:hypothetical protein